MYKRQGLYKEITVRFNYLTYNADFYEFPGYTKYIAEFDGRKEENWSQKYTWDDKMCIRDRRDAVNF